LKGLLLIAQINFQRATGRFRPKIASETSPDFISHLGDKKTQLPNHKLHSAIRFEFRGRVIYFNRITCQRTSLSSHCRFTGERTNTLSNNLSHARDFSKKFWKGKIVKTPIKSH